MIKLEIAESDLGEVKGQDLSFPKMILEVLFDGGSARSKEIKLEALTRVKEKIIILELKIHIWPDPESLSEKEATVIVKTLEFSSGGKFH